MNNRTKNQIVFKPKGNSMELEVHLQQNTVWMEQKTIASLFNVNVPAVSKHISNIYSERELKKRATVSKMEIVQKEGDREVKRWVDFYNLDMIISVGYRVNSKRATEFRIWATKVLRSHLIKGYSINRQRLTQQIENFQKLQQTVALISKVVEDQPVSLPDAKGLIRVISDYAQVLRLLEKYDQDEIQVKGLSRRKATAITHEKARSAITKLRKRFKASHLFGSEKDDSFKGTLMSIYQTYNGKDVYPSLEEKAANLLYLIIKNHPFVDGNKRIGSLMFIWFLERNDLLYKGDGSKIISENALVAIALMVAQSKSKQKDLMIKMIMSLINANK